ALAFAVSESNPEVVYLSRYWSGLYKSIDGGNSFKNISDSINFNGFNHKGTRITSICISPTNENEVWICLGYLGNYENACNSS
ncbi:hypothetical protein OEK97_28505, partial [Escherichia coli]|uniref:hypothetical protein n=1 Tax=Escherichia coli TaxID=562 RepID=UPI0021D90B78